MRRQRLVEKFVKAVVEHHKLQTLQVESLIQGAGFLYEVEIGELKESRDRAKYAILAHEEHHGCG